jgi:uncharacterized lipoprotein YajG
MRHMILIAALILAGCGDGSSSAPTTAPVPVSQQSVVIGTTIPHVLAPDTTSPPSNPVVITPTTPAVIGTSGAGASAGGSQF